MKLSKASRQNDSVILEKLERPEHENFFKLNSALEELNDRKVVLNQKP